MQIGILSTRSARYHPNRRLLEAGRSLGHRPRLLHPRDVRVEVRGTGTDAGARDDLPDVVLPRIGATINESELAVVFHLERLGIPTVNGFAALAVARDKFLSLRLLDSLGIPVPRTFMATAPGQMRAAVRELGGFPVVMKAPRGRQGTDVHLVKDWTFARYLLRNPPRPNEGILIQEYLPSAAEGDVRVLVAGRAVASMRRVPRRGEFRANAHLRGRGHPCNLPQHWVRLALQATETLGLEISGVDLMEGPTGPLVLEVNTTPGFRELERATRLDVAREIVRFAVKRAEGR